MSQIVSQKDRIDNIRGLLEKHKAQITLALPKHLTADRLLRVALTAVGRQPELLECTPVSLFSAIVLSGRLGLEPDGALGHAYLIPFRNTRKNLKEVQFIIGYRGLLLLARNSGEISTVQAQVVHERDEFSYLFGLKPVLTHKPFDGPDPGKAIATYAIVALRDGGQQFDVMLEHEVNRIRARSKAKDAGPWVTDTDEMWKKTVLRRLCKLLPASIELQRAVGLDELASAGLPQDLDVIDIPQAEPEAEPKSKLDVLAEKLGAAKPTAEPPQDEAAQQQENQALDAAIVAAESKTPLLEAGKPGADSKAKR